MGHLSGGKLETIPFGQADLHHAPMIVLGRGKQPDLCDDTYTFEFVCGEENIYKLLNRACNNNEI